MPSIKIKVPFYERSNLTDCQMRDVQIYLAIKPVLLQVTSVQWKTEFLFEKKIVALSILKTVFFYLV